MGSEPGYEEVRRQLRERGYLEGRLERFVLKDLISGPRGLGSLGRASLKAALLGAPLLAALMAGAAAAANRPLVSWSDLPVLWLYFLLVSAPLLMGLDLLAAALTGRLARRRGARTGDAARAAVLVGVPVLGYLWWVWWRGHPGGALWEDVLFLIGALLTSLVVSWLAGLVSLAAIVRGSGQVPERRRRRAIALLAALLPLSLLLLTARGFAARQADVRPPSPFDVAGDGPRLLVIGLDGLDRGLFEELAERGSAANLNEISERATRLPLSEPTSEDPAVRWTTRATGVDPAVHGVLSLDAERLPGVATPLSSGAGPGPMIAALRFLLPSRTVPTSSGSRRARDLAEIVALRQPSLSVGCWASWPAAGPERGGDAYVVSDRVLPKLLTASAPDRDTEPEALFTRLRGGFEGLRESLEREFELRFGELRAGELRDRVWQSFLIDGFNIATAAELMEVPGIRVSVVYLPGRDILRTRMARSHGSDPALHALQAQVAVESYVGWLDEALADLTFAHALDRVVLIGDPGRGAGSGAEGFVWIVRVPDQS
jgi:hypothetical protein